MFNPQQQFIDYLSCINDDSDPGWTEDELEEEKSFWDDVQFAKLLHQKHEEVYKSYVYRPDRLGGHGMFLASSEEKFWRIKDQLLSYFEEENEDDYDLFVSKWFHRVDWNLLHRREVEYSKI